MSSGFLPHGVPVGGTITARGGTSPPIITMETFSPQILHKRQIGELPMLSMDKLTQIFFNETTNQGNILDAPQKIISSKSGADELLLLRQDTCARKLALEYQADVILTDRVLESLLKADQWILPLSCEKLQSEDGPLVAKVTSSSTRTCTDRDVIFIEDPLPSSTLPRQCLTIGFTESLYGQVLTSNNHHQNAPRQYVYTLLKVVRQGHTINMLVRSENYVLTEIGDALSFETSLEYFCDQGMEVVPVHDRAYWFMQKILQPSKRQLLCRIDPCTARILSMKQKTVADAITVVDEAANERGVSSLYSFDRSREISVEPLIESMFDVLFATTKLERDTLPNTTVDTICKYGKED